MDRRVRRRYYLTAHSIFNTERTGSSEVHSNHLYCFPTAHIPLCLLSTVPSILLLSHSGTMVSGGDRFHSSNAQTLKVLCISYFKFKAYSLFFAVRLLKSEMLLLPRISNTETSALNSLSSQYRSSTATNESTP